MGTRLIYELAKTLEATGFRVVRFDFRSVGRSEGEYGKGTGEIEDALAVYDALAYETEKAPIIIGFSFGGAIAIHVAGLRQPSKLVCISTPRHVRDSDLQPTAAASAVQCPTHFIHGSNDEVVPLEETKILSKSFEEPGWTVIDGADHFLTPTYVPDCVTAVRTVLAE
jgi:alpha/beta superfamily hydrolase